MFSDVRGEHKEIYKPGDTVEEMQETQPEADRMCDSAENKNKPEVSTWPKTKVQLRQN